MEQIDGWMHRGWATHRKTKGADGKARQNQIWPNFHASSATMVSFSNKPTARHSAQPPAHTHTHTHTQTHTHTDTDTHTHRHRHRRGSKPVAWEIASHGTAITPKYVRLTSSSRSQVWKEITNVPHAERHVHTHRPDDGTQGPVSTSY